MKYLLTILLVSTALVSFSQEISRKEFKAANDSISIFSFSRAKPIPKRSALYSAIFPGLGQAYNKQYWKLGIVGAGLGVAGYFIHTNNKEYKKLRAAYIMHIDNNPATVDTIYAPRGYSPQDINQLQNQSRQYLEYSVIFTTVGYALNILDAYVAAHLRSFDINDDISFKTKPTFENRQIGLALVFNLK